MKNKFISSTILLVLGGFVTKFLGFIIKIVYTRIILEEGVSLYSLITPTYSLLITIATLALPLAISKLVAEEKTRSIRIISSSICIILLVNLLLVISMFFLSKTISFSLLKNEKTYYLLLACTMTLPFISISAIVKGYFFGKQRMFPYILSNALEQVFRLVCILLFLPHFMKKGVIVGVFAFILLNILSELFSVLVFFCFLPKKVVISKKDIQPDLVTIREVLSVSLPTVSSRFIGNIGFFLEPILLTNILLSVGYSNEFILMEYGAYNAYSIALLTMPSFFVGAISSALIPEISKFYYQKNLEMVKRRFKQALFFSFLLGLLFTIVIFVFRDPLLWILYQTKSGSSYIKALAPFFVLFYLETPLISTLQGLGMAKFTMKVTFVGVILKTVVLAFFSFFKIGLYGLILSEIINIIFVVSLNYSKIKRVLLHS